MTAWQLPAERNLFGYLAREFEPLGERPVSDVDSLVLACLSYYRLPEAAALARTHEGVVVPSSSEPTGSRT